jgi:Protein of unknown function (DUF3024)
MAFSELELELIDKVVGGLCREMNRPEFKDELSIVYLVEIQDVIIFEKRTAYQRPKEYIETPAAKLKYLRTRNEWQLLWMRGDLKWHGYNPKKKSVKLSDLVAEIKSDPYGCFWG